MYGVFKAETKSAQTRITARFRKLQTIGLPLGQRPGRGERTGYNLVQICEILLCLLLSDFGLELRHILDIIDRSQKTKAGHKFFKSVETSKVERAECFLHPDFVADLALFAAKDIFPADVDDTLLVFFPNVISLSWDDAPAFIYRVVRLSAFSAAVVDASRFAVINLTVTGMLIREELLHGDH